MRRTNALAVATHLETAGLAPAGITPPDDRTTVLTEDGEPHGHPHWVLVTVVSGPWVPALETARRALTPLGFGFETADGENTLLTRRL